ncbi:RNase adapter RapZ, partial [Faecalicoccus pleomorphus]|uniref:RNase adapter RapZ n=1 Tax=Faecalicoccus pleomorphus TaxID=1323 RepID=UPI002942A0E4
MKQKVVLVTGMSGAGKSSAMNALEDMGYYCIDNFPKELLPNLETLLEKEDHYQYVALSVSSIVYLDFVKYFKNMPE